MVFSSIPPYQLDPANWHQQPNHQLSGTSNGNPQLQSSQQPPPPAQPLGGGSGGGGAGSIRPGSMTERARLANIPMPEGPQKCPRCDSANTKFCYFNNYSLSQPRHFCKACRRYWTRGGALRTVPVGGGCRRNKRSKSARSKSPAAASSNDHRQTTSSSTGTVSSNSGAVNNILGLTSHLPPLRFMSPLGQLTDHYNSGDITLNNYSGISAPMVGTSDMNFQMGANFLGGGGGGIASLLSNGGIEQWRMQQAHQQYPFFSTGLDPSQGLYQFHQGPGLDQDQDQQSGFAGEPSHLIRPKLSASLLTQMASVKMENNQELNLSRQFLGIPGNDDHHWNNNNTAWTDLSSFSSSSTSNPL